jgi:hypothetical protein
MAMTTEATMATLKIELDRGHGWQVRAEGEVPENTTVEQVRAQAERLALNGPTRAFLNGELVAECKKLTKKQAERLFSI